MREGSIIQPLKTLALVVLLASLVVLGGCGTSGNDDEIADEASSAQQTQDGSAADESSGGLEPGQVASASAEESEWVGTHCYSTQEVWVDNGGASIYGIAYIPDDAASAPLVVFAHELGNDHTAGEAYAEVLASHGYAVYTFDFRGGSVSGNRSDGVSTEMSVMTEVDDLSAVVDAAKGWDFVDGGRIAILGGSQGGCVSAIYAADHAGEIDGLMLLYPALSIYDDIHAQFASVDDVPATYGLFGGWMTVGRNYATDMWDYDPLEHIGAYPDKVLIVHGDADSTVDVSYSERAARSFADAELHVIAGAGHGFSGAEFDEACGYILAYLGDLW